MINLAAFQSRAKQNTVLTIRSSYQDVDELSTLLENSHSTISQRFLYDLSLKGELRAQSSQRILKFLQWLLTLNTLSQEDLEEVSKKLESIQQIYDISATYVQKDVLPATAKSLFKSELTTEKKVVETEESFDYQESESPEIINSFLSMAKAMPVAGNYNDSIYSDEELDNF